MESGNKYTNMTTKLERINKADKAMKDAMFDLLFARKHMRISIAMMKEGSPIERERLIFNRYKQEAIAATQTLINLLNPQ